MEKNKKLRYDCYACGKNVPVNIAYNLEFHMCPYCGEPLNIEALRSIHKFNILHSKAPNKLKEVGKTQVERYD